MPNLTSFTRLETYEKCPSKYEKHYLLKLPADKEVTAPMLMGTLAHGVLEEWLDPNTETQRAADAFELYLPQWLKEVGLPEDLVTLALELAPNYASLLQRASPNYVEADAIRTKDGSPAKDLENYPPSSWTHALKSRGLMPLIGEINDIASVESPIFREVSCAHMIGLAYFMACHFEIPAWVAKTVYVEKGFSQKTETDDLTDAIAFPGREDLFINAYLDWVVETTDGRLVIIDHKSSKKCPSVLEVSHHAQLNLYAWLVYKHTGELPDVIGINHMRSQSLVLAPVDPAVVQTVVKNIVTLQNQIDSGHFPRRLPTAYNTPCISRDWRSGVVKEQCPYLEYCWPQFKAGLETELLAEGSNAISSDA